MKKSILLVLAIICAMLQASAQLANNWYDNAANHPMLTKTGNVIKIDTEEKLARLAYEVNEEGRRFTDTTVVLMKDLDLSTHYWTPIGLHTRNLLTSLSFQGTFDGNGKTISGLNINDNNNRQSTGLFAFCYGAVTIKDLTLDIGTIKGKNNDLCFVGALAGYLQNDAATPATITNCHVLTTSAGSITGATTGGNISSIGGLIGSMDGHYMVTNCSNAVDVLNNSTVGTTYTGGLIASFRARSGTPAITSSFNTGNVRSMLDAVGGSLDYIGGIAGYIWTNSGVTLNIADCYSKAIVTAGDFNVAGFIGGIVGHIENQGTTTLTHCYAAGEIVGGNSDAGGIAGFIFNINGTISLTHCVAIQTSFTGTGTKNRILGISDGAVADITLSNNWAFIGTDQTLWGNFGHDQLGGASLPNAAGQYSKSTYDNTNTDGPGFDFAATWYMPAGTNQTPKLGMYGYAGGDGSASSPFIIQTRADLDSLSRAVNLGLFYTGKHFKLDPVDANGQPSDVLEMGATPFIPIGQLTGNHISSPSFRGSFDGNGKTISGLIIDDNVDRRSTGLFGYCYGAVTIKDLTLDIGTIQGKSNESCNVGALAGDIRNNTVTPITITNCHIKTTSNGSVTGETTGNNDSSIGGLIGYINGYYKVTSCSNAADVLNTSTSGRARAGGLIGNVQLNSVASTITSCFNTGKVRSEVNTGGGSEDYIGGIVGYIWTSAGITLDLKNCYSAATITSGDIQTKNSTGGIVGYIENYGTVNLTHCYAAGMIDGKASDAGGILGNVDVHNGGVYLNNCLAILTNFTGTPVDMHRILGEVGQEIGPLTLADNYALQTMPGALPGGWPNDDEGWDGAHWTGTMTDAPINVWAAAGWTVDLTGKTMPKLGITGEPDVPNPMYKDPVVVPPVNPTPQPPVTVNVSVAVKLEDTSLANCVTVYPGEGEYQVDKGSIFTLLAWLNDDCDESDLKVVANGVTIEPDEKKTELRAIAYTFQIPVTEKTTIELIGVKKNNTIGTQASAEGEVKVWTSDGHIHIRQAVSRMQDAGSEIRIYTIHGELVVKESIISHLSPLTYHLPKGTYIVVVGDTVTKVVL